MAKRGKPRRSLAVARIEAADEGRPHSKLIGQSVGWYKEKLATLRKLGIDPMRGVPLTRIKSLGQIPPDKKRAISRIYDNYADLFQIPHIIVKFKVPEVPPVPKLRTEKELSRMSEREIEKYTARLESWMAKKQAHDETESRLLAAQDFGGHKILDRNLKAAVIPVIAGDPKKARLSFIGGKPVLRDAQGKKTHVPLDHKILAKHTDKYLDAIVKEHGTDKRYQLVTGGRQFLTQNVSASELKKRVKKLMTDYAGKRGNYQTFLRGILVYKENSLGKAQREKKVAEIMADRAIRKERERELARQRAKQMAAARSSRYRVRNKFIF